MVKVRCESLLEKWRNSASLRIPASILHAARLRVGQEVVVREECGHIVIEPVPAFDLATLIARITDENGHAEIDFGEAVGNESDSNPG
jgi:antitoxin MazE